MNKMDHEWGSLKRGEEVIATINYETAQLLLQIIFWKSSLQMKQKHYISTLS